MLIREPAVEGRFYPSSRSSIFAQIAEIEREARYLPEVPDITQIFGGVLPHAGHIYSGHQTVPFFKLLKGLNISPKTFVIIHPNHGGTGPPIAIDESDIWVNSIGEVPTNDKFAHAMELPFDGLAHKREHSAEVIVPFLQYYLPNQAFSMVAVSMRDQSHKSAQLIAESILKAEEKFGEGIMVLSSCDFSHFVHPLDGMEKDQLVVDEILSRNSSGIEKIVKQNEISICGYGPIMALMEYAKAKDPGYETRILARGHSGEVHYSLEVVDYITMIMYQ